MRCLEKQPSARPANAGELVAALDSVVTPSGAVRYERATRSRTLALGIGIALVVAAVGVFAWTRRPPTAPLLEPKRVVVATFDNKSGDPSLDPLGAMAADWIARGLLNTGLVDVGGTAEDLAAARTLTSSGATGAVGLLALAHEAKAGIVISGAYYKQGDSVLFQADFTDANAGKLIQSVGPVSASAASPLDGVERLRQRVTGALAPLVDSTLTGLTSATSQPPSLEAYREFLAGEELSPTDERAAIAHYSRAASLDSSYIYPLLRVAGMYRLYGTGHQIDSIARIIRPHQNRLTPYEQAYFQFATCRLVSRGACLDAAQMMTRLAPKSPGAALTLAVLETQNNHYRTSDSILAGLDPESGALRGRHAYFNALTANLHMLGDHVRELQVAHRAESLYPNRLHLLINELRALVALGRLDEFNARFTVMLRRPNDPDARIANAATELIYDLRAHDHPAAAESLGVRMLAWLAARPLAEAASLDGRSDRAEVLMATHRWNDLQSLADSLANELPSDLGTIMLRGVALAMRGRREEALSLATQLERGAQRLDMYERRYYLSLMWAALGEKARAVAVHDEDGSVPHGDLLYELLRDYPPYLERVNPRE